MMNDMGRGSGTCQASLQIHKVTRVYKSTDHGALGVGKTVYIYWSRPTHRVKKYPFLEPNQSRKDSSLSRSLTPSPSPWKKGRTCRASKTLGFPSVLDLEKLDLFQNRSEPTRQAIEYITLSDLLRAHTHVYIYVYIYNIYSSYLLT